MDFKIYSVHGTFAADKSRRGHRWWQIDSQFSDAVLKFLDTKNYRVHWEPFQWSGENSGRERSQATQELSEVLSKIGHHHNRIALVAHSHGGNVAFTPGGNFSYISVVCTGYHLRSIY